MYSVMSDKICCDFEVLCLWSRVKRLRMRKYTHFLSHIPPIVIALVVSFKELRAFE